VGGSRRGRGGMAEGSVDKRRSVGDRKEEGMGRKGKGNMRNGARGRRRKGTCRFDT
jgi:hypothetical protein